MVRSSFVLGGTRGLGAAMADVARTRGITAYVAGRSEPKNPATDPQGRSCWIQADLAHLRVEKEDQLLTYAAASDVIVWCAGFYTRGPHADVEDKQIDDMIDVHLRVPLQLLRKIIYLRRHAAEPRPLHLVTIGSTTAWLARPDQALYSGLKAAKAQFTRTISIELARDFPGSTTTLVQPGGMNTEFFAGTDVDPSRFMDPAEVAAIIWKNVLRPDRGSFLEINIRRTPDGAPIVDTVPKGPLFE